MNYVDNDAGTCLHLATKVSWVQITLFLAIILLVQHCTAVGLFFCSLQLGYADAVRALLAAGSDPTIANKEGATPFDYCSDKTILGVYNEELLQASAKSK